MKGGPLTFSFLEQACEVGLPFVVVQAYVSERAIGSSFSTLAPISILAVERTTGR